MKVIIYWIQYVFHSNHSIVPDTILAGLIVILFTVTLSLEVRGAPHLCLLSNMERWTFLATMLIFLVVDKSCFRWLLRFR